MDVLNKKIRKILDSWIGLVIFILVGVLIVYFIVNPLQILLYTLIIAGIPVLYYFKKQDILPYIYGGIIFAFMFHFILGVAFSTNFPVVAVVSSSMQHDNPNFTYYDWLKKNLNYDKSYVDSWPITGGFLIGDMPIVVGSDKYEVGDVIVYTIPTENAPIIHRIIKINDDGTYQTKGDNNPSQLPYETSVRKEQIQGKVMFVVPKLGYLKVLVSKILGET